MTHGSQRLVAYIVLKQDYRPGVTELRDFLRPRLPRFALPGVFVPLAELPQTPNGKTDRQALPDPQGRSLRPGTAYLEPHTETQRVLCNLFEKTLGVDRPGVHDNFFDLGGDSLSAVDLLLELERHFGTAPTLTQMFARPTPFAIAEQLTGDGRAVEADAAATIRLNQNDAADTLFVFAGKGGSVMCMRPLAERLHTFRVIGMQYPGVADGSTPMDSVRALAQRMTRRILKTQADDGYHLMGYSFGGLVAFETARLLREQQHKVASLTLLDTVVPGARRPKSRLGKAAVHLRRALARYPASPAPPEEKLHDSQAKDPATARFLAELEAHAHACERAARQYRPEPYDGPITLIRCDDLPPGAAFYNTPHDYGWSKHCSRPIQNRSTPGHHLHLFEHPYVEQLANLLNQLITQGSSQGGADVR